jgi:hypothetical protein
MRRSGSWPRPGRPGAVCLYGPPPGIVLQEYKVGVSSLVSIHGGPDDQAGVASIGPHPGLIHGRQAVHAPSGRVPDPLARQLVPGRGGQLRRYRQVCDRRGGQIPGSGETSPNPVFTRCRSTRTTPRPRPGRPGPAHARTAPSWRGRGPLRTGPQRPPRWSLGPGHRGLGAWSRYATHRRSEPLPSC